MKNSWKRINEFPWLGQLSAVFLVTPTERIATASFLRKNSVIRFQPSFLSIQRIVFVTHRKLEEIIKNNGKIVIFKSYADFLADHIARTSLANSTNLS